MTGVVTGVSSISIAKTNGQLAAIARHSDDLNRMIRSFVNINRNNAETLGAPLWDAFSAATFTLPRLSNKAKDKVNDRRIR